MQITVGRYTGSSITDAKKKIKDRGVAVEIIGNGDTVTGQTPKSGSTISLESGRIILYSDNVDPASKTAVVPDILGCTAAQANEKIINAGLNIEIKGAQNYDKGSGAIVTSQSYAGGTEVPYGTVITIEVLHMDATD